MYTLRGRDGVKAKVYIYTSIVLCLKTCKGEWVSENHQIWADILYGWSLLSAFKKQEFQYFQNNILGVPHKAMFWKCSSIISWNQTKFNILSFRSNQFDLKHEILVVELKLKY